jgi:putative flippase GtrA
MVSIETLQGGDKRSGDIGCMTITLNRPAPYPAGQAASGPPVLDVVIPVYNEQDDLEPCVRQLHAHLAGTFPYPFRITIADNASTDDTLALAETLQAALAEVRAVHLPEKGRGRALRAVWLASDAPVLAYMDVDLSTDLTALLPLVAPLLSGHSDLAIGTRLARTARVVRGTKREFISRSYNVLLHGTLHTRFSDAQCGFKAIRREVAQQLLPLVEDSGWFFDTELLVLAERAGLRIAEVPVDWIDDPDSRVDIVATALADLRGVARLGRALATGALPLAAVRAELGRAPLISTSLTSTSLTNTNTSLAGEPPGLAGQAVRFAAIGVASTLAYLLLFVLFRGAIGAQPANLLALLITAVANTATNRRVTFGRTGRTPLRVHGQGLAVFALGVALTSGALAILAAAVAAPGLALQLAVLIAASTVATALRFVLFRRWIFPSA